MREAKFLDQARAMLRRKQGATVDELAARFKVTPRTVQRWLLLFAREGYPLWAGVGRPPRYRIDS